MRCAVRTDRSYLKCRADIGAGVDEKLTARRPGWIRGVFLDERYRRAAPKRNLDKLRLSVPTGRDSQRFAVRRPCGRSAHVELVGHSPSTGSVDVHHVELRAFPRLHSERESLAVRRDGRCSDGPPTDTIPELRRGPIGCDLPQSVPSGFRCAIDDALSPDSWRDTTARGERDRHDVGFANNTVGKRRTPEPFRRA